MELSILKNIRFVLVEPTHPGNIGAVARAMKTQCLSRLYLVNPKRYPSYEATARASGADDVLDKATLVNTLEDAIKGCSMVIGASARRREMGAPEIAPDNGVAHALTEAARGQVAILFGREHSGLTNKELELCHYLVNIPANPDYSSLNIAAAAQVFSYEIYKQFATNDINVIQKSDAIATSDEVQGFFEHLEKVLLEIRFLNPAQPKKLMARLRRLFNRSRLEKTEVNILRGILKAVEHSKDSRK